jgi:hypothetical protein
MLPVYLATHLAGSYRSASINQKIGKGVKVILEIDFYRKSCWSLAKLRQLESCQKSRQVPMERRVRIVASIVALSWLLGPQISTIALPSTADAQTASVRCVKRKTELNPPGTSPPSLGPQGQVGSAPILPPVCPPGEVPIASNPKGSNFPKGNPLLGNSGAATQAAQGAYIRKNVRPFDQVYWKRDKSPTQPGSEATKSKSPQQ